MQQVATVALRRSQTPIFPERCVFSDLPNEGETIGFLTRDALRGRNLFAGWYYTRVPCRRELNLRVHLARAWQVCRTLTVGLGSMALAAYLIYPRLKDAALGLTSLGISVMCIIGVVIWEKSHPPSFNIAVRGAAVEFQFLDWNYAEEFAKLNAAPIEAPTD
jgi:hypothetical protein